MLLFNFSVEYWLELFLGSTKSTAFLNRRGGKSSEQRREYTGRVSSYELQQRAFKRAEKLQDSLDPENPSFVKTMVRSHVSSCFWLVRSMSCIIEFEFLCLTLN
jgi:hypothetical protein